MPYLLRRWWVRKYALPPTSAEYLAYTVEELLVEFFEDYFERHPDQQIRREVHERSGHAYFVTGDPLVDRWERELAEGREPDLDEGLTAEQRAAEDAQLEEGRRSRIEAAGFEGIDERYEP